MQMTYIRGTVKLFTSSFEIDAPNIASCAPKIFSCVPKNLHLVAQVLPNSNLNFEPCTPENLYLFYFFAPEKIAQLFMLKEVSPLPTTKTKVV